MKLLLSALLFLAALCISFLAFGDTMDLRLHKAAAIEARDAKGATPLQHARSRGYAEIVKLLETAGAT
ncbi:MULTISPECIES: ankyrin repeat-containing protein [Rhizobium]|uniref:Ankyrin repeat domain-containing protein n=1 Tax=Rhizobium tropici TaxID=398 RepID=A0ABR6QV85_RHITR|nr:MULTISPECIES: ankyrin repeat-containing protein [Rhizobium]AGB74343.1 ankyrin repeat-containing protein [Rhizobium tropici CIAT 899]MBB4240824.1 hypothetical protein [Rhizobium tropici]MBB5591759.1 hypothetical protein [Rhizobium tropici]MBB6490813.1 hypothetical protein [Rhizobium tropici]TGF01162.1 hypothetical protein C9417_02060 [Rhizobium sp. SEMIA 4088]